MFDKSKNMSRRNFIKTAGVAGLGSALGALGASAPAQASEPMTVPVAGRRTKSFRHAVVQAGH